MVAPVMNYGSGQLTSETKGFIPRQLGRLFFSSAQHHPTIRLDEVDDVRPLFVDNVNLLMSISICNELNFK